MAFDKNRTLSKSRIMEVSGVFQMLNALAVAVVVIAIVAQASSAYISGAIAAFFVTMLVKQAAAYSRETEISRVARELAQDQMDVDDLSDADAWLRYVNVAYLIDIIGVIVFALAWVACGALI